MEESLACRSTKSIGTNGRSCLPDVIPQNRWPTTVIGHDSRFSSSPMAALLKPLRSSTNVEGSAAMVGSVINYAFIMMIMVRRAD